MTTVFTPAIKASIQFGNSFDTGGADIITGSILAEQDRFGKVFLVQVGNIFGLATKPDTDKDGTKADYYCTTAYPVNVFLPAELVSSLLGFPVELFEQTT